MTTCKSMNRDNRFFKSADEINERILDTLKSAKKELNILYNTHQKVSDLKSGFVYKKGLYLPYSSVEHRILFDGYEVQFLSLFIDFFSRMSKGGESIFKEFAIRTIAEMGLKDSQILFSSELNDNKKNKFKTIIMLADYAFLGLNHPGRVSEYKKLLKEQKHLLTQKQLPLFTEMSDCLDVKDGEKHKKLVKKIRRLIDSTRSDLYQKTQTPKVIRTESVEAFFSAFSHLIHGNIILLTELFSAKRPKNRNKLRVTWILLMAGINTLIHVNSFLEKKKIRLKIGNLFEQFEIVSKELANYWRQIERPK